VKNVGLGSADAHSFTLASVQRRPGTHRIPTSVDEVVEEEAEAKKMFDEIILTSRKQAGWQFFNTNHVER
jgi:hypothetical protein